MLDIETILFYVAVGAVFFAGSVLVMVFLFGLSMGKTLKNTKGVLGLILISMLVPIITQGVRNETSTNVRARDISLSNFEVVELSEQEYLVTYTTSEDVVSYIQLRTYDGEIVPVVPTYTLTKRADHSIVMPKDYPARGTIIVIAGGQEIELQNGN